MQFPFSYLSSDKDLQIAQKCKEADMGFVAMKALAGGLITDSLMAAAFTGQYDNVLPIYIELDDGERLQRALNRERLPENGKYAEMCRRFLSDDRDFSEERIKELGIKDEERFVNDDLMECAGRIRTWILKSIR